MLFNQLLRSSNIIIPPDDPFISVNAIVRHPVREPQRTTVVSTTEDEHFPAAGEAFRSLEGVEVCLGAGVGEAQLVEAEARAEERGECGFLRGGAAEGEAGGGEGVLDGGVDDRVRVAVEAGG